MGPLLVKRFILTQMAIHLFVWREDANKDKNITLLESANCHLRGNSLSHSSKQSPREGMDEAAECIGNGIYRGSDIDRVLPDPG